ncbi:Ig-like domain-containing protein [Pseudomonas aegrilactucae]|uniref:Ig-like domain-containing protein n=1 Tax=Pseudomonas aegrilactucae TaxID=2854028 RepID=A0A9Q3AB89_9PSED|nr:Ig-like domain-containing protein [Pseudomonas aegrilactucae]MBV6286140.1 Ig-like domain-containing protein [Pseudomonas aegrilactucae]
MRSAINTSLALLLYVCLGMVNALADTAQNAVDPNLQLPRIAGLQGNALDPQQVPEAGLNITVDGVGVDETVVLAQNTLTIYLADVQGQTLASVAWPVPQRNAGKSVTLPIEKRYLKDNLGKTLQVYYTLTKEDLAPKRSDAVAVLVREGFSAQRTLDLSSHPYIVFSDANGVVHPPPTIPTYAQFTRVQPGAQQYTSDNDAMARVDANGQVSVWGNGSVTITATTAAGTSSSYTLTVRGVRQLQLLSTQDKSTWAQAQALASAGGYSVPTEQDFRVMLKLYSLAPGTFAKTYDLNPYWIWGQAVGAGTAVYLDMYDDLVTAGYASEYDLAYPAGIR